MAAEVDSKAFEDAAQVLSSSRRAGIAVLTGAGVSAESGVPTFRGAGGLWKSFRAEQIATPEAFGRDPALVWEFYNYRRGLLKSVQPNAGHVALAMLERSAERFALVTQNVDGLHQRAGSRRVLELHGNIWRVRCTQCGCEFDKTGERLPALPTCEQCGGLLRPGVVWFGESLSRDVWQQADYAARECGALLVIGTSAQVHPAAALAWIAHNSGARVMEVNLEPTPAAEIAAIGLYGRSAEILPKLVAHCAELRE